MSEERNAPCPCGSGKKYKKCCLLNYQPDLNEFKKAKWSRIQSNLVKKLYQHVADLYGESSVDSAYEEFTLYQNDNGFDPDNPHMTVFMPWFFYEWIPDPSEPEFKDLPPVPPALSLAAIGKRLSQDEIGYLKACSLTSFSFYEVVSVELDVSLKLKDILTDEEHLVFEKNATHGIHPGDLLFGKVINIDDIGILEACAPIILHPSFKVGIINLKEFIQEEFKVIDQSTLHEYQMEILECYHQIYNQMVDPRPPVLTNTDGELMSHHVIEYEIENSHQAFESLHKLCFKETKEQMIEYAIVDKNKKVLKVEFPWIKKSPKKSQQIILANINIDHSIMTVEVNSKERVSKFKAKLKKTMPSGWTLKKVFKPAPDLYAVQEKNIDENPMENLSPQDRAEFEAFQNQLIEEHWHDWPNHPVPALGGQTPIEASKTKIGREKLDALISDFERNAKLKPMPMPGQDAETFKKLRKALGLE